MISTPVMIPPYPSHAHLNIASMALVLQLELNSFPHEFTRLGLRISQAIWLRLNAFVLSGRFHRGLPRMSISGHPSLDERAGTHVSGFVAGCCCGASGFALVATGKARLAAVGRTALCLLGWRVAAFACNCDKRFVRHRPPLLPTACSFRTAGIQSGEHPLRCDHPRPTRCQ